MNNLTVIECENEVLRAKLAGIRDSVSILIDAVERYLKQDCLRSELFQAKEDVKALIKR